MQNQAKKTAIWQKLLSSLAKLLSSLGETAEQFGETAGQTADDFGEICFFSLSKFIVDTKNHMVIKRNMVQSCSLWSPFRKNIPFEGFLKNKYLNEPFLGIRKTYIREPADQTTCFQRPWQFCALLFPNKLLQYFASPIYLSNSQPPICLQYASNMFPSWPSFSMLFWPAMWACS